jgi:putative ABC transport system ATP-binding protein
MTDVVVHSRGLCKSYHMGGCAVPVLADVNLSVRRGECVFLVGPSGSGKTTLLSILGCMLRPDAGQLTILNESVTTLLPAEQVQFRRKHVGFVFQRFHLFRGLSAWENIAVVFELVQRDSRQAKKRALDLLEMVGLANRADFDVGRLSNGQQQRVALARALAADPALLLADEPTAALDAETGHNAMELIRRLAHEQNKAVVVVTHDPRIVPMADRVLKLENGRLAADETPPLAQAS